MMKAISDLTEKEKEEIYKPLYAGGKNRISLGFCVGSSGCNYELKWILIGTGRHKYRAYCDLHKNLRERQIESNIKISRLKEKENFENGKN